MATSPDSVSYAETPYGLLGPLVPGWINAQDFGADPTGVDVATPWIQAAANAVPDAGGVLLIPPGLYRADRPVYLKSNTKVYQYGATHVTVPFEQYTPAPYNVFSVYAFFVNENLDTITKTDEGIEVHGGTFDYSDFGAGDGGAHSMSFQSASRIRVVDVTQIGGDDCVACRFCDDVQVIGCNAYDFGNAAWDFWWGCTNVRVIGCYSNSDRTVQHANFQCSASAYPTGQVAENFVLADCIMVHPAGGSRVYSSVFLDPFGTGNITQNVVIKGCQFHNVIIAARGDVRNVLIQGCQFFGGTTTQAAILSYADAGNTPDSITVDNCLFFDPQTASPNVAVIDLRGTNNRCTNNKITGSGYSVAGYTFGGNYGIDFGNEVSSGALSATAAPSSGTIIKGRNNIGFALLDSVGGWVKFRVQSDDNLVLIGTNGSDAERTIATMQMRNSTSSWTWSAPVRNSNYSLRTLGDALTATGTVRTDALDLTAQFNNVTTTAAGAGVRLPNRTTGELVVRVRNGGANALNVYPYNSGDQIDALGVGNPFSLAAGEVGTWCLATAGQWYTAGVYP